MRRTLIRLTAVTCAALAISGLAGYSKAADRVPVVPRDESLIPHRHKAILIMRIGYSFGSREAVIKPHDVALGLRRSEDGVEWRFSMNELQDLDPLVSSAELPAPVPHAAQTRSALIVVEVPEGTYEVEWVRLSADGYCDTAFTGSRHIVRNLALESSRQSKARFRVREGTATYLGYIHVHAKNEEVKSMTCKSSMIIMTRNGIPLPAIGGMRFALPMTIQTFDSWAVDQTILRRRYPKLAMDQIARDVLSLKFTDGE